MYSGNLLFLDSSTNANVQSGASRSSDFTTLFQPYVVLGGKKSVEATLDDNEPAFEIALINFSGWNSVPNISAAQGNNTFQYVDPLAVVHNVVFDDGIYSFAQMQSIIQADILAAGFPAASITLTPNTSTAKVSIGVAAGFTVNFVGLWRLLAGFEAAQAPIIGATTVVGNLLADITAGIDNFLVHCDFAINSTIGGSQSDVIFTYRPNAPPGAAITFVPATPMYVSVRRNDYIDRIRMYITDQRNNVVDFRGEDINFQLHIRRIKTQNIRILPSSLRNLAKS
jgi:hypothetical protein